MMELKDIHTLYDAAAYVEGTINDLIEGVATKSETMVHLANYTARIMEIFHQNKEKNLFVEPKNPKLVEICKAEDMVEYYAKKLKEANIHLKKLKQ